MRPKTVVPRMPSVFQSYFECGVAWVCFSECGYGCPWWVWQCRILYILSTSSYQIIIIGTRENSLQDCMDNFTLQLASKCPTCSTYLIKHTTFVQTPPLLFFDLSIGSALTLDSVIWISCENSCVHYILRGVVYFTAVWINNETPRQILNNKKKINLVIFSLPSPTTHHGPLSKTSAPASQHHQHRRGPF
jgi:hypothetical protein